ncbi:hypothetical protein EOW77_0004185 [Bradyrhizobium yuanmingense]|nr:hypothetical protein EOW77_0004185 [Bradyrhizobium yuanmingense]
MRAQRSNPESFCGGSLDCFAALAMTETVAETLRRSDNFTCLAQPDLRHSQSPDPTTTGL